MNKIRLCLALCLSLFSGLFASENPAKQTSHTEYYWGLSTDTSNTDPSKISKELFVGTRTDDLEKKLLVDDQLALSEGNELRPQKYIFDLNQKTVTIKYGNEEVGSGAITNFSENNQEITQLKYSYKVTGDSPYSYEGEDTLLNIEGLPYYKVNRERGTVTSNGKASTFEIIYIPISFKEYKQRKKAILSKKK